MDLFALVDKKHKVYAKKITMHRPSFEFSASEYTPATAGPGKKIFAKEELQSTNEELITLNEELENRNFEMRQVNNDLLNLLGSVHISIVMLGSDLRIRRFTPMAEKVFNVIPTDVGRRISDIKPNVNIPDLEKLALDVADTLRTVECEVQDQEGHWYSLRIRPYRTTENMIEGVVITLVDIDLQKRSVAVTLPIRAYGP